MASATRRRPARRRSVRSLILLAAAPVLLAGTGLAANWRLALVAAVAGGAIALTRLRYAPLVATALLAAVLLLAQSGNTAGSDRRDTPARSSSR